MKIGILTYHRAHNYGAMLQAFALLQYLTEQGYVVEIIDYWPFEHEREYQLFQKPAANSSILQTFRQWIYYSLTFGRRWCRIQVFKTFLHKNLHIAHPIKYRTAKQIPSTYDYVIIGSDQIWRNYSSPTRHIGFDPTYFGVDIEDVPIISYAASMGYIHLNSQEQQFLKNTLARFKAISVREEPLQQVLAQLGITSQIVCDPTFLLSKREWMQYLPQQSYRKRPYILLYEMVPSPALHQMAQILAKQYHADILQIQVRISTIPRKNHNQCASPFELLHAIRDAQYVVTTSFHGTAFSVIFEKQFVIAETGKMSERIQSLLRVCHLQERYTTPEQLPTLSNIDYATISSLKEDYVMQSKHWLNQQTQ